jgi:hypothetical protein
VPALDTSRPAAGAPGRPPGRRGSRRAVLAAVLLAAALGAVLLNLSLHRPAVQPVGPAVLPVGALSPGVVPAPGQVGFLGDRAGLRVLDPSTDPPDGSKWVGGLLRVDATNLVLDRVLVRGSIDFYGTGTLALSNSVVTGASDSFATVQGRRPSATLRITDSTLTWPADAPPPSATWGGGVVTGAARMDIERCDLSGAPDGVQQGTGHSRFVQNYIHDLRIFGTVPNNSHNDGLQFYEGPGIDVRYNRIELHGFDGQHQNSAVFLAGGAGYQAPQVIGNYLSGGGYPLRIESGAHDVVVQDNTFGPLAGGFGEVALRPGATIARWSGNVDATGAPVPDPRQG